MDALLSSFYFTSYHYEHDDWYYYGMPPVSFRSLGASFRPDYSIFFLCDSFYVDVVTMDRVKGEPQFAEHVELFDALKETGRLKVIDYRETIKPYDELIDSAASRDVSELSSWVEPFLELRHQWRAFAELAQKTGYGGYRRGRDAHKLDGSAQAEVIAVAREFNDMVPGILDEWLEASLVNWKGALSRQERERTRHTVWPYLAHVAATLCLADCLGAVIHDWADIGPLYRHKLSRAVAVTSLREQQEQETCRQLLALMFPDFHPKSSRALARLLDDRRTETLRDLVRRCVQTDTVLDVEFANSLLRELLEKEERLARYRNIAGWLTVPLSFVPWAGTALEKGAQLMIDRCLSDKVRADHSWFFLLSGVNDATQVVDGRREDTGGLTHRTLFPHPPTR